RLHAMIHPFATDIHECDDGSSAQQRMMEFVPDLVVLDCKMTALGGWELLGAMRESPRLKNGPVMLCTGELLSATDWIHAEQYQTSIVHKGELSSATLIKGIIEA